MTKSDNGHGGRRKGAGRPRKNCRLFSFRCPGDIAMGLSGRKNRSDFINNCIRRALEEEESLPFPFGKATPASTLEPMVLPRFDVRVAAGFPVPIDNDEKSQSIDILNMLCPHPEASYLIRVIGDSMIDAGIFSGDIVIVDKSNRTPSPKEIAVCELNGEYTLKRYVREGGRAFLVPANPEYPRFPVREEDDFSIWGTVTYIIHKARD